MRLFRRCFRSFVAILQASRGRAGWSVVMSAALGLLASTCVAAEVDFDREIRPIFERHCLRCHGVDKQEGGLRLDARTPGLKGGDNYTPAIVPGKSADSPLWQFVSRRDADLRMPPKGEGLGDAELDRLRRWIDEGAKWPEDAGPAAVRGRDHWSFQPVVRPPTPMTPPPTTNAESRRDAPVDGFIEARLAPLGLTLSPRADRRTLIRRLHLVMLGLPPSPEEVEAFESDERVDAWERLVDRVLANPRYGERWAPHWLDLVRFGETNGFETNRERPTAWHYRDYVVRAFNRDKPYDRFLREQLAGDSPGETDVEDSAATGFLVAGPYDLVKSQDVNLTLMQRQDELADIVNTTGTALLGLTLGCARCHNHKFDPITQRDFYAWQAVFAGVLHGERALPAPPDRARRLQELDGRIAQLVKDLEPFLPEAREPLVLVDDSSGASGATGAPSRLERLREPRGEGEHPAGTAPGFAQDPGDATRSPNLGGGRYTWWENRPDVDVGAFRPRARGLYRIWISWGAGFDSHARAARFVLDADGDPATTEDQETLAVVDQRRRVGEAADSPTPQKPLWSGFLATGAHRLTPRHAILVRGGGEGSAVTADAVALEAVQSDAEAASVPPKPALREPVQARRNIERLAPAPVRFLRFTILATNSGEPCLDELEAYAGGKNVAAGPGVKLRSSGDLQGYPIHRLEHLNDGRHGNSFSWISSQAGGGWVELELPEAATIDRIEWGRDREGRFADRVATRYRIETAERAGEWRLAAGSDDRLPSSNASSTSASGVAEGTEYRFDDAAPAAAARGRALRDELLAARTERQRLAKTESAYIGTFQQPGPTKRLFRGDPTAPREEVGPDTIALLGRLDLPLDAAERDRRAAFARWIVQDDHPLTARVWANRLWQFQFGRGLVDTANDFGANGVPPTHPELLDWLAAELVAHDWSTKHLQRRLLLSATWTQDSRPTVKGLEADGATQFWWRFPPRRLEAEPMRDGMLAVSGALDLRAGGPGFDGFDVQYENVRHYFPKSKFGPADWRRMVYMVKVRMEKESTFGAFDCPDASQAVARRGFSTTPLQALNLLNSPFVLQQAEMLAARLSREAGSDVEAQADRAFRLCFGRPAEAEEREAAGRFVRSEGVEAFCRAMLNANEFLFIP